MSAVTRLYNGLSAADEALHNRNRHWPNLWLIGPMHGCPSSSGCQLKRFESQQNTCTSTTVRKRSFLEFLSAYHHLSKLRIWPNLGACFMCMV